MRYRVKTDRQVLAFIKNFIVDGSCFQANQIYLAMSIHFTGKGGNWKGDLRKTIFRSIEYYYYNESIG